MDTIPCPNCGGIMEYGGECEGCGHVNSDGCDCEYCRTNTDDLVEFEIGGESG